MKQFQQLRICLLILLMTPVLTARSSDYNPNDPPEPQNLFMLTLDMNNSSAGSVSGEGLHPEGESVWVYAYVYGGYNFTGWYQNDSLISTSVGFNYIMPARPVKLKALFVYNPSGPSDPANTFTCKCYVWPANTGYFSYDNQFKVPGSTYNIYAYPYSNYAFDGWYRGDSLISENSTLSYTTLSHNDTLYAHMKYQPGNPSEPNSGTSSSYNLSLMNMITEGGRTLAFPLHLFNQNQEVNGAYFNIVFPKGISVDYANAALSSRKNGHSLFVEPMGPDTFFVSISEESSNLLSGSSGVLMTIPCVVSDTLQLDSLYPVKIYDSFLMTPGGELSCPAKNGGFLIQSADAGMYASFYPNIYLNRAHFVNLSANTSESFLWDFGDGSTSTETNPLHIYEKGGSYTVKLIASNSLAKDSATFNVIINPQSQWRISGSFSFNQNVKDVKNFGSLFQFIELLDKCRITGDLYLGVAPEQVFDYPLMDTLPQVISRITARMETGGLKMHWASAPMPESASLNFMENIDQNKLDLLIRFWKTWTAENILVQIEGTSLDVTKLNAYQSQYVCSRFDTEAVDFRDINPDLSYSWSAGKQPAHTTGYMQSGFNIITPMLLLNEGDEMDTLVYNVNTEIPNTSFTRLMSISFFIKPEVRVSAENLSPADDAVMNSPQVSFSWSAVPNALYDIYLWEKGKKAPEFPTFSGIKENSFTNSGVCKYGKAYRWKVAALGDCNATNSDSAGFAIRALPDLRVEEIIFPDSMFAGDMITVKARIKNLGSGAVPNTWWRDELSLCRTENLEGIRSLNTYAQWREVPADSSYWVEFKATLPLDTIRYSYFIVKSDIHNNVLELNETNNITLSNPIQILQPRINPEDFTLLKAIFQNQHGNVWRRKWKINSDVLIAENWPGVHFQRARVTDIDLSNNLLEGEIDPNYFTFGELNALNLSYNALSGNLNEMPPSGIKSLNLSNNQLEGEISSFANRNPMLGYLNLSGNHMQLDSLISKNITQLYIQYQNLPADSLNMKADLNFDSLPGLCTYDHNRQDFSYRPSFNYYQNGNHVGGMWYWGDSYHMSWNNYQGWRPESGAMLERRQSNGYAYGSAGAFKFFFRPGDSNADSLINIQDLQHAINFILLKYPNLFNFNAVNFREDENINVQDLVGLIDLILSEYRPLPSRTTAVQSVPAAVNNSIRCENGKIYLDNSQAIAALQFNFRGFGNLDFASALRKEGFSDKSLSGPEGLNTLIYNLQELELQKGSHLLGELTDKNAYIEQALACDIYGQLVPLKVTQVVTKTEAPKLDRKAYMKDGSICIFSTESIQNTTIKLYDSQGRILFNQYFECLPAGETVLKHPPVTGGVYLIGIYDPQGNVQFKINRP